MAESYYAIIDQRIGPSAYGGEMVTITFLDIQTREECVSYIDEKMENFFHWADVITQPEKGFVVTGLKKKKGKGNYAHQILNADCEPIIVREFQDVKQMERKLRQSWAQQDFEATPFGRLFDDQ